MEKSSFVVKLESFDAATKIKLIKEIRTCFPALGLKEAKEMVDKAPSVLGEDIPKAEAESVVEKLKAVGGTVVLE